MQLANASVGRPDPVTEVLLRLCRSAAGEGAASLPPGAAEVSDSLLGAARDHGLLGFLYQTALRTPEVLPEPFLEACREAYHHQTARSLVAARQLREIGSACAASAIPVIVLKGGAALLNLYEDPGCRQVQDLDLLIPEDRVPQVRWVMTQLGYAPRPNRSSEAEEVLFLRGTHMRPYTREGRLLVEFHISILQRRASRSTDVLATRELWEQAIPLPGGALRKLAPAHAALHAALHYVKDLERGFASLKGLVDLLLLARGTAPEQLWPPLWDAAERWGVAADLAPVLATLHDEFGVEVPGLPAAERLPRSWLVHGLPDRERAAVSGQRGAYRDMLGDLGELPDPRARLRVLWSLLAPAPERLRLQYAVPEGKPLTGYYFRRLAEIAARFLQGRARETGPRT